MKRISLTPEIETHLRRSLGADADLSQHVVFEAIALNTLPLRKSHPIYKDARMDTGVLYEMAMALVAESRPVQIMHDKEVLPVGRVFHGEVADNELRVLFFIDPSEASTISKIENGTVDQVSVSVLTKQILNSVSGFDYLGPDADFEHFFSGTDNDGNTIGENGCYARLVGLDSFFEMSLVGQGGARNARIVGRDESYFGSSYQKLAANGIDPSVFVLAASASTKEPEMDLTELVAKLTSKEVELHDATKSNEALTAELATLKTERDELKAELDALKANETVDVAELTTERDNAVVALKNVASVLLTASGKLEADLPDTTAELAALIEETKTSLAAKIVAGGVALGADHSEANRTADLPATAAFRVNRKK